MLQVRVRSVYQCLRTGELPGVRFGRLWRIHPDDLEAYLRRGATCAAPPDGAAPDTDA